MNKIVREHYPVEKLPEDWRQELGLEGNVTLTIVAKAEMDADEADLSTLLARVRASRPKPPLTAEDAVARIRALREEWDDR